MNENYRILILQAILLGLLGSCAPSQGSQSVAGQPVLTVGLTPPRVVLEGRALARRLASGPLGDRRPRWSGGGSGIAGDAAVAMAGTPDGSEYLSLLVSCALSASDSLISGDLEFFGELGLASDWIRRPLGDDERGWVSACVLASLNDEGVALPISLRGRRRSLRLGSDEVAEFPVWAGAFYGDVFSRLDRPLEWFACRGSGQVSNPTASGLVGTCAREDADHPGLSPCGMTFVGDCSAIVDFWRRRGFGSRLEFIDLFVLE
jgi:hypothetical protein